VAEKPVAKPAVTPVNIGGESFLERLLPHLKKIIAVALVVVAILGVIFGLRWRAESKRESQTAKLAEVLSTAAQQARVGDAPADPATPSFANRAERGAAVLNALAKNNGAPSTGLLAASMLFESGKFEEAIGAYQKLTSVAGIDGALAREGLGLALEAKAAAGTDAAARQKGYEEALAAFKAIEPAETGERKTYALYHEARMLALIGKKADAKAVFAKAKEMSKSGGLGELIDGSIAALENM
jgi:tetratricopeptide (TPR) repeat protein